MKSHLIFIFFLITWATKGQVAQDTATCYLKIICEGENTTYNFDSVTDLEANFQSIIPEISIPEKKKKKAQSPPLQIEISITHLNKTLKEIVAPEIEVIKASLKKLKTQLNIPIAE